MTASQSTQTFVADAQSIADAQYTGVRTAIRDILPLLAALSGSAETLRAAIHNAADDETTPSIAGQFFEADDKQKTVSRLSNDASNALRLLGTHLRDVETFTAQVDSLVTASLASPAPATTTTTATST